MAVVGVLVHRDRESASSAARDLVDWLTERGHEVRAPHPDAALASRSEVGVHEAELVQGLDLLVGIGGDGTILRAVDLAADQQVPVLGVNAGQLGYLSSIEPEGIRMAMKRFLAGSFEVEERMRLRASWSGSAGPGSMTALNEIVLERSEVGHTVRIEVSIDGELFTPYVADGVIVATPTGSTAYAFSVRGPIIAPSHRALLVAPVSPHMLFDRCLVLDPTSSVQLTVSGHRAAQLIVDGRSGPVLADGDQVSCATDVTPARVVVFGRHHFHDVLRSKFSLPER